MSEEDKVDTPSDFTDKTLNCKDCGADWVFSAGEQEFYAEKALENEPTRCKECRKEKKAARNKRMRARRKNKSGPASNVCFAFQKGECTRGDECRFKHELVDEATEETTA
mmetsp:Transcript_21553/g.36270  ORF Transcript_21553/g.36270 Transcript_21553/m.36270 type:complete len:110 (+) Transcript_21553:47-376(+)